jgi:hypothetical protein
MYQNTFETDVMDDLFYDTAEGPSRMRQHYDAYDTYDDGFDAYDTYDAYDEGDAYNALEDEMADALGAADSDEFLQRIAQGVRQAAQVARSAGRVVGQAARAVAPIASAIPLPQAQAIGRVAQVAGRLLADGADEFEALDTLVDLAEAEDLMDVAAPAIASTAVRAALPQAARLPANTRQQLVRATAQTAHSLAQQQGPQAVRALPAVVQAAQQTARQQGLPPRSLPQIVQRLGMRLSRNPQLLQRLLRTASPALRQSICAACGSVQARPAMAGRRPAL